jgi:multiple sugar transport system permease protein
MQEWMRWSVGDRLILLLARDVVFMKALVNTLLFALVVVPAQAFLGLGLALLVNKAVRGISLYRTVYFVPVVISMVVVAQLWGALYNEDPGVINAMLGAVTLGAIGPIDWLGDPAMALFSIMALSVWQGVGFHMIIWLAGLQVIPPMLYEAARIDGAGRWAEFRHVTWPGLRHTAVFVFVIASIQAFGLFTQVDRLTGGGPLDTTQSVIFQAYERGFGKQDVAIGSAISVVFFALVLAVTLVQRFLGRERRGAVR